MVHPAAIIAIVDVAVLGIDPFQGMAASAADII
jgi:hypothetical protein